MKRRIWRLAGAGITVLMLVGMFSTMALAQMGHPWGGPFGGPGPMMGCQALWSMGFPRTATPLTIDQAVEVTQKYLILFGNPDLVPAKVIDFANHFQATVKEKSTGANAFSLLIDKLTTGAVCFEPGPSMMWNTKYQIMGWGRMHGPPWSWWPRVPTTQMPVTLEQAKQLAQNFLNAYLPSTTVDAEVDTFYGFYNLYAIKDGKIFGELSVNGYTGWVWYHTWHGPFVAVKKL